MSERQRPPGSRELEPIGTLIAAARRGIKQAVGAHLRGSGLSPQQFWVLMAIDENPCLSLRALCERRRMDAPTASRVVATLAAKRLVRIAGDHADRRRCCLELTAEGHAVAARLAPLLDAQRAAIVDGVSLNEQKLLRDLLRRVIANMARFRRPRSPARRPSTDATLES